MILLRYRSKPHPTHMARGDDVNKRWETKAGVCFDFYEVKTMYVELPVDPVWCPSAQRIRVYSSSCVRECFRSRCINEYVVL